MKKILIGLLILFTLFNNSNCMEEKEENFEPFQSLPPELRHKIINSILEENINSWDDIFKLDRNSLKEILDQIALVSKDFLVLEKEELKNFIRKLKQNRFAYLQGSIKNLYKNVSQEELNKRLTDLLESDMSQNNLEESVRLIIAGADINTKADNDWTALMNAAYQGHTEIVKLLIDVGADIDIQDNYGRTALMLAASFGHTEIVKLLIDAGADINIQTNSGWTALIKATYEGHIEIVKLLIDAGADIDVKDQHGLTALMMATRQGHTEIVRLLINAGADINTQNNTGWTALMRTAHEGHTEVVRLLIDAGVNINIKDNSGRTALMNATYEGHTEIVRLLSKQDQSFFASSCMLQ